jgi:hypothetical protein
MVEPFCLFIPLHQSAITLNSLLDENGEVATTQRDVTASIRNTPLK